MADMEELNAPSERRNHYKNKLKSLCSSYYKSATLCFFSKVSVRLELCEQRYLATD